MKRAPVNETPRYLSARAVADRYGIKVNTVWVWARAGKLPAPVRLSARCTRWDARELERLDAQRRTS
jgi:predicted DNA-binding transcriptional regulator AlpA